MGLAASQARLLTITARLADNELRSQTINNAKMRLATQSAQASDEYVCALNNTQLMFSNIGADGLTQKQALSFNALTQYSQYNTQYGIVNSAGQLLVSEEDAAIFQKHPNDLEGFLKAHGLEWETTFFDETSGNLAEKLTSFYGTEDTDYIAKFFENKTNAELKQIYLDSISQDASIEKLNYEISAKRYYTESKSLYKNATAQIRSEIFPNNEKESTVAEYLAKYLKDKRAIDINQALIIGKDRNGNIIEFPLDDDGGVTMPISFALANIEDKYTVDGYNQIRNYLSSVQFEKYPGSDTDTCTYVNEIFKPEANEQGDVTTYTKDEQGNYKANSQKESSSGKVFQFGDITIVLKGKVPDPSEGYDIEHPDKYKSGSYIRINSTDWTYGTQTGGDTEIIDISNQVPSNEEDLNKILDLLLGGKSITYKKVDPEARTDGTSSEYYCEYSTHAGPDYKIESRNIYNKSKEEQLENFVNGYFSLILSNPSLIDLSKCATSSSFDNAQKAFKDIYGFIPAEYEYLLDFNKLIENGQYKKEDGTVSEGFQSVLNSWLADKMLDVLGEPKYAWIDKNDPQNTGNADSKAQWLTNLFNRMQKGYKVLENGLAKSSEWLEYAFESGLVTMEQVDLSFNWMALDYKTCANIYEETDNSAAVAKAEAKYNRAMNDIKQKDQMYDLQLKNIDTEHTALQTEYDVVKGVMNKNIERTMKFNQSA